jgi:hypothetical protein
LFWIKTALIAVAGINMVIFEFITVRDVQKWNVDKTPPQQGSREGYQLPAGSWSSSSVA